MFSPLAFLLPPLPLTPHTLHQPAARHGRPLAALDYKNPAVATEFAEVNELSPDEVSDELALSGIMANPAMNDMDVRLMLVEVRMRKKGTMPGATAKPPPKKPASYANEYEKALWEKPAFKELIDNYQSRRDTNAQNLAVEYLNNPQRARELYGRTELYDATIKTIEEALNARVEQKVTSGRVYFAGFPSAMGEAAVRMTFSTFGEIVDLSVDTSDDGMTCVGQVEFEGPEAAKAAIDKYDGVDMGLGTTLELTAA